LHWIIKSFTLSTATKDTLWWFCSAYETTDNPMWQNQYKCSYLCKLAGKHIGNCRLQHNTALLGPQNFRICCWPHSQWSAAFNTLLRLCSGCGLEDKYWTIVYALLIDLIMTAFLFSLFKISHFIAAH
jgi:hypothetical protein